MKFLQHIVALMILWVSLSTNAKIAPDDSVYIALRSEMGAAFNAGDSAEFHRAIAVLEDYCLAQDDLHAYYTQRCNEIVFLLNREDIFGAYKNAILLSRELRERNLSSEMYMAINMMGHVYNYCGNREMARRCFSEVIEIMQKNGYTEGLPPIYMNQVQVEIDENPEEAMRLLDLAAEYSKSPDRLIDVEAYRAVANFKRGEFPAFLKGYELYKELEALGYTSVHGVRLEAYNLLYHKNIAGALKVAQDSYESTPIETFIYEWSGDWKHAYQNLRKQMAENDSINAVILSNSMVGIQNELDLFEAGQKLNHQRIIVLLTIVVSMLVIIVVLLIYSYKRRRDIKALKEARDRAMESDNMKTEFINNVSHEIRTPLNIITGFTQVMGSTEVEMSADERKRIVGMMSHNTRLIVSLVDEILDLSMANASTELECSDLVNCNQLCREVFRDNREMKGDQVETVLISDVDDDYKLKTNRIVLQKVINALIDNALKFTEKGEVRLRVRQLRTSIAFVVEDTGKGIPDADIERVFDRFEKLDSFKPGLGLGLTLARALVARLKGTLMLDTTYKEGARFVVTLPLNT
jgi:signal transduction histidine kinase